jgi:hypothetical protein
VLHAAVHSTTTEAIRIRGSGHRVLLRLFERDEQSVAAMEPAAGMIAYRRLRHTDFCAAGEGWSQNGYFATRGRPNVGRWAPGSYRAELTPRVQG